MKKDNFKLYFDKILSDKYLLTKDGINGYWINKLKQESFDRKKTIGISIGLSELMIATSLCVFNQVNDEKRAILVIVLGGIGWLTTKVSITKKNPYDLKQYKEIDKVYTHEKIKYKKNNLNNK